MRNPYLKSTVKRLKRKSPGRFALVCLLLLPKYLVWQLSRPFSGPKFDEMRRGVRILLQPLWVPFELLRAWVITRQWKSLIFATPLLAMGIVLLSVVYVNKNTRRADVHKRQVRTAHVAMQEGDFAKAGLVFGRLIHQPQYQHDPDILYPAMVVAYRNGNGSRYLTLRQQLIEELDYAPARRWIAQQILSTPGAKSVQIQEAIEHLTSVLEQAKSDEEKDQVVKLIAELYMKEGRSDKARTYFELISDMAPSTSLMLAQVYLALDNSYKAEQIARELLVKMKADDPQGVEFVSERVSAYLILATSNSVTAEQLVLLKRAYELLEKGAKYQDDDRRSRARIAASYFQLSRLYLSLGDDDAVVRGMVCLAKSLETGEAPSSVGWMLLNSCDPAGNYLVSEESVRAMLLDGHGAVVCHLRLGLDAWRLNKNSLAVFHFQVAKHQDAKVFDVLRNVARYLASADEESIIRSVRFALQNKAPWVTALELLNIVAEAEGGETGETSLARCDILAARERWSSIPAILEPALDEMDSQQRLKALSYLSVAYTQMFDYSRADYYKKRHKKLLEEGE